MLFSVQALEWLEAIMNERFGHRFALTKSGCTLSLRLPRHEGAILFGLPQAIFHKSHSDFQCGAWDGTAEGWEMVLGRAIPAPGEANLRYPLIERTEDGYMIHYDVLGLTYWMLSRLEEVDRTDVDEHDRFPAVSSHAFKHDYLERPIVDEWMHVLGQVIQRQWPELKLKQHQFSVKVSHDVDYPTRYGFRNAIGLVRGMVGDALKRHDLKNALIAPWVRTNSRRRLHPADPVNTFEWIMSQSERRGLTSAFYFICGRTNPAKDADYEPEHPAIRNLMQRIHQRGHEIGLHPSFNTYRNPQAIVTEAKRLRDIMDEEGIHQQGFGGRMHFLRWQHPTTMFGWEQAGLTYDSTLGYADRPGFRCGTCYEYPAFDPVQNAALQLRIRPLIAMECTVIADRYMGLGAGDAALAKFVELKDVCRRVGGCFTLLWHNSELSHVAYQDLYTRVLDGNGS